MNGSRGRHPLLPNRNDSVIARMLQKTGTASLDELFSDIPEEVRLGRRLRLPEGMSEYQVRREVQARLSRNMTPPQSRCFLGGGVWPHYVPAAVESITSRQEFYTSYTPYQAEVSQGMLQALFEYQSMMCDLLAMEACNSSLYDWASAAGEAVRMAGRVTGRKRVLVAASSGPPRTSVIKTYSGPTGMELDSVAFDPAEGTLDIDDLERKLSDDVACLYLENPNFFGVLEEDAVEIASRVHAKGGLMVTGVDPISLSLVKPPGSLGTDVAVGEGQPLGIPMNYGGPHLGIFAVKDTKLARSMPGRLIGMTTALADPGRKAFAMALQAREQHIRREGATSNICTNESLMAVAAASYLSLLGKDGFIRLGQAVISNSHYAARLLSGVKGARSPHFRGAFFKEFVVSYRKAKARAVFGRLAKQGILAGSPIPKEMGLGSEAGLYCVTEVHNSEDIEALASALEGVL